MRHALRFPTAVATAALLAVPAPAHAGDTPTAWWVNTRPWTCARWSAPLAQEIQLACDAGAGCSIASDEHSASRCATLVCSSDDHWTLEASDRSGRILWRLALQGSHQDRLRQAGVWVARSDAPDDVSPLPADPPPPRASTPPELPVSPAEPAAPSAPAPSPPASDKPAAPPSASGEPSQAGWLAFSASAQVGQLRMFTIPASWSLPVTTGGSAAMGGLHGAAIAHSTHGYGGLSVAYEHSLTDFGGMSASLWRPGAVLGWGAPYGDGWWGVSVGAGVAFVSASQSSHPSWASSDPSIGSSPTGGPTHQTVTPVFTELALHAKPPRVFGQQPFVSVSGADVMYTGAFSPGVLLALDLGVVWND
jgi:hypothetical protein